MALVARSSGQLIQSTDVDQFKDLLTGVMTDQNVTLANNQFWKARSAAPGAATAVVAAGGSIDVGAHDYIVTFVGPNGGETLAGTHVTATTTTGNQTVNLSAIPTGPTGTTSRNIYRSKVGTSTPLFLLHTIGDNVTTTYSDAATDASLPGTQPPAHPSFGGSTQWQDNTGAVKAQVYADGAVSFDAGNFTSDGAGNVKVASLLSGTFKAADGTSAFTVANSTGAVSFSAALTAPNLIAQNGAVQWANSSHYSLLGSDQGGSIELGAQNGVSPGATQTPYIDFHSSNSARDFDVRIQASGGGGSDGQGTLILTAAGGVQLNGALTQVGGVTTAGPYGAVLTAKVGKDVAVNNTTQTTIVTFTTPNDAANHTLIATAEWFVGGSNTNAGTCTLQVTYTDPHAGAVTLQFCVYGSTNLVNAFSLAKGLVGRTFPRELNCSPNTTVTITYQNTSAGTIADTCTATLLMTA